MDKQKFLQIIEEQFEEVEAGSFDFSTKFKEKEEWDSLVALSIIAVIDTECSVDIDAEALEKASTIEDLYNIVMQVN